MTEEKGIFLVKEEESIAKFLDSLIDFNEMLGNKRVLLVVKLGKFLERKDRKLIQAGLAYIDDAVIEKKVSEETKDLLIKVKDFIIAQDLDGLSTCLAKEVATRVKFLSDDATEEKVILGALTMVSGLLSSVLEAAAAKYSEGVESAENEDESN